MPTLALLLLLWAIGSYSFPATSDTHKQDAEMVQNYLQKYYNLERGTSRSGEQKSSNLVAEKLKQMQKFFGLKVTGKPDAETLNVMKQPRCGVPDVAQFKSTPRSFQWERTHLTYRITNYTPDLPKKDVDHMIEKAFELWSNVSVLTFTKVFEGEADILISFYWRDHRDNSPFDGPGGGLAHAFLPGKEIGGDIHFDEEETWTNDFRNYNLYYVAAHELGHSLGINHIHDIDSLMYPAYMYYGDIQLSQKDIKAINALYGPKITNKPQEPQVAKEPQVPRACDTKLTFDAITKVSRDLFFFKNRFFLRTDDSQQEVDFNGISLFWPLVGAGVDAAYEIATRDEVFFFRGSKYWAFNGGQPKYGYPRDIHSSFGFPGKVKKIDAAVHQEETGKTYFFVANKYWRYDEYKKSMDTGYPKAIIRDFPGIGKKVDAVFQNDGFFYFFCGTRQYQFDPKTKRILSLLKTNSWFNCK